MAHNVLKKSDIMSKGGSVLEKKDIKMVSALNKIGMKKDGKKKFTF